ncbi:MAG: CxxC-x17-CxxC domain-containing protein [Candidatus Woesearchaeota archaeon]
MRRDTKRTGNFGSRFSKPDSSFGPREMHKATCADCGKECEVPFQPTDGRPVYCKECYPKHKPQRF